MSLELDYDSLETFGRCLAPIAGVDNSSIDCVVHAFGCRYCPALEEEEEVCVQNFPGVRDKKWRDFLELAFNKILLGKDVSEDQPNEEAESEEAEEGLEKGLEEGSEDEWEDVSE